MMHKFHSNISNMGNHKFAQLIILLNLANLFFSLACPTCPNPTPPTKSPPKVKPPYHPKPPVGKPPPPVPKPPPPVPKPPVVKPPVSPTPPSPCPPPPKAAKTCPIDTLKLSACVDVLGGLGHVGIGKSAKDACCPVLEGVVGLDAAICLCTTIKAKLLNVKILLPIALEVIVGCGKTIPSGFQCPA